MNYTQEQLAALADKGATAAMCCLRDTNSDQGEELLYLPNHKIGDAPARIAFARAVLEGAEEMEPKVDLGEPIVSADKLRARWLDDSWNQIAEFINRCHAERVAGLRAEIERLEKAWQKDRDYIKKLDGIIEEVGGVTVSCINPYEDLKRTIITLKARAKKSEAELAEMRRVQFGHENLTAALKALEDAGMCKEGKPNTLRAMVQKALAELRALKQQPVSTGDSRRAFDSWWGSSEAQSLGETVNYAAAAWQAASRHYEAELTSLRNWKAQALSVEKEWDEQALAKKLGGQLGQSCRAGVERLLKENEALKALREQPQDSRKAFEKWDTGTHHKSDFGFIDTERYWQGWQAALSYAKSHDTAMMDWLERKTKESRTGISFDCLDGRFRFMRKHFIGDSAKTLRDAITLVMEVESGKPLGPIEPERAEEKPQVVEISFGPDGFAEAHEKPSVIHEGGEVVTPPEGYHLATDEERRCLPNGSKCWFSQDEKWVTSMLIGESACPLDIYACPDPAPFRVTFTDGKINPPPFGYRWATQEDRILVVDEKPKAL